MRRVLSSFLILCAGGALGGILRLYSPVSVSEAQAAGEGIC